MKISSNDRVFIAGKTGSGKTFFAMSYLFKFDRLLIVDSKDGLTNSEYNLENLNNINQIGEKRPFRYRVVNEDLALEAIAKIYSEGNAIVYIDEVGALIPSAGSKIPKPILDVWQRGRSRGVGGWAASQRPVDVPRLFLSEAEHFFAFRLTIPEDKEKMAKFMNNEKIKNPIVDKYGFYYYSIDNEQARYFKGVKL